MLRIIFEQNVFISLGVSPPARLGLGLIAYMYVSVCTRLEITPPGTTGGIAKYGACTST